MKKIAREQFDRLWEGEKCKADIWSAIQSLQAEPDKRGQEVTVEWSRSPEKACQIAWAFTDCLGQFIPDGDFKFHFLPIPTSETIGKQFEIEDTTREVIGHLNAFYDSVHDGDQEWIDATWEHAHKFLTSEVFKMFVKALQENHS